jgi:hypothetical protein
LRPAHFADERKPGVARRQHRERRDTETIFDR